MVRAASLLVVSLAGGGGDLHWAISSPKWTVCELAVTVLSPCCICLLIKVRESLNV